MSRSNPSPTQDYLGSVFALEGFHDGNPDLLLEAAGKPLGVLFVKSLPLESRINAVLVCLPQPRAFGNRQGDIVHLPKVTDHAVEPRSIH